MTYEEKKTKVVIAIVEASKFVSKGVLPSFDGYDESLQEVSLDEIAKILKQFEEGNKLKFVSQVSSSFDDIFNSEKANIFTIEILDIEYFNNLLPKAELRIEDSPMRKMREITNYVTGTTDEERARLRAIENNTMKTEEANVCFIEYKADRNIRLNGKIPLYKPQFGSDGESLFKWLYDNPNKVFTKDELEKQLGIVISDKFQKITDRWNFRAGLKETFFDIHEDSINPNKSSIKFKNPVTL